MDSQQFGISSCMLNRPTPDWSIRNYFTSLSWLSRKRGFTSLKKFSRKTCWTEACQMSLLALFHLLPRKHKQNDQDGFFFVCLFIATRAIFQLSGGCHHCRWQGCKFRPMLGAQGLWAGRDLYRATPTVTRDLGLYGLIRKTGTHVPQWDSNPRRKDHQILAPDALTTAPIISMSDTRIEGWPPTSPKVHQSEGPLVRRSTSPKAH
jgi:hypothetical protein